MNPPAGPVASSGKTLSEVEPRVAITLANTPGDANSIFKITQPGSYYLAANIAGVSGKHGIEIAASNVSIDLMGFALEGVLGSLDGVSTEGLRDSLAVRNGTVSGWGSAHRSSAEMCGFPIDATYLEPSGTEDAGPAEASAGGAAGFEVCCGACGAFGCASLILSGAASAAT